MGSQGHIRKQQLLEVNSTIWDLILWASVNAFVADVAKGTGWPSLDPGCVLRDFETSLLIKGWVLADRWGSLTDGRWLIPQHQAEGAPPTSPPFVAPLFSNLSFSVCLTLIDSLPTIFRQSCKTCSPASPLSHLGN